MDSGDGGREEVNVGHHIPQRILESVSTAPPEDENPLFSGLAYIHTREPACLFTVEADIQLPVPECGGCATGEGVTKGDVARVGVLKHLFFLTRPGK